MFEVGKTYRTRGGGTATVDRVCEKPRNAGDIDWPIMVTYDNGRADGVTKNGFRFNDSNPDRRDLLPGAIEDTPPEPVETLRDRFAMAALTGRMARNSDYASWADAAADAYECADAMLAEREKPHGR